MPVRFSHSLDVRGNNSDIRIREAGAAGAALQVTPGAGPNVLTVAGLTANNVSYTESSADGIQIGSHRAGNQQKGLCPNPQWWGHPRWAQHRKRHTPRWRLVTYFRWKYRKLKRTSVRVEAGRVSAQAREDIFSWNLPVTNWSLPTRSSWKPSVAPTNQPAKEFRGKET